MIPFVHPSSISLSHYQRTKVSSERSGSCQGDFKENVISHLPEDHRQAPDHYMHLKRSARIAGLLAIAMLLFGEFFPQRQLSSYDVYLIVHLIFYAVSLVLYSSWAENSTPRYPSSSRFLYSISLSSFNTYDRSGRLKLAQISGFRVQNVIGSDNVNKQDPDLLKRPEYLPAHRSSCKFQPTSFQRSNCRIALESDGWR